MNRFLCWSEDGRLFMINNVLIPTLFAFIMLFPSVEAGDGKKGTKRGGRSCFHHHKWW